MYYMDVNQMIQFPQAKKADVTVAALPGLVILPRGLSSGKSGFYTSVCS